MRVLFVGNSFLLYHDVPGQVRGLAEACGHALTMESVLEGGAELADHWRRLGARERLADGGFSHVVLQGKSTAALLTRKRFRRHAARFAGLATSVGARILMVQTWAWRADHDAYRWPWARRSPESWLRAVSEMVEEAAHRHGAQLVPVGDAFAAAIRRGAAVHDEDRQHASADGAYLAALMLHQAIWGEAPPPWSPTEVEPKTAHQLRQIASSI